MYIEKENFICYNAIRQREVGSPNDSTTNENPRAATLGFSILFLMAEQIHRLVTDYLSLSNHLMMQWQITPPNTVTTNGKIKNSNIKTPPIRYQIGTITILLYNIIDKK